METAITFIIVIVIIIICCIIGFNITRFIKNYWRKQKKAIQIFRNNKIENFDDNQEQIYINKNITQYIKEEKEDIKEEKEDIKKETSDETSDLSSDENTIEIRTYEMV